MRGTRHDRTYRDAWITGSSPRMRGTLPWSRVDAAGRFIPAHAGNTRMPSNASSCNDRFIPAHAGNTSCSGLLDSRLRFIPAHAGNTGCPLTVSRCRPVHPRACGEHRRPATQMLRHDTVHPRACGEHTPAQPVDSHDSGSSPRMRGTPSSTSRRAVSRTGSSPRMRGTRCLYVPAMCYRFIPAHAGNTAVVVIQYSVATVHPRACGEHFHGHRSDRRMLTGSSPRMRGTQSTVAWAHIVDHRFIPAHAGNT